ncbi:MAG: type II secretion system F family protein [Phycisphaerae bacterium]
MQSLAQVSAYLFYFLPAAGSMLLVYGIYQVVIETKQGERRKVLNRLQGISNRSAKAKNVPSILRKPLGADEDQNILSTAMGKLSFMPKIQTLLDQCNLDWSAAKLMTNLALGSIVTVAGLYFLKINLVIGLSCGAVVIVAPLMVLSFMRKRRMSKLTMQLPDVFEMMSQALRAGHSLASAMQLIHEQMPDPIASEFGQVFHEQNLGIKIEDALLAMADRVDTLDVRFFVTAVLIQRQTGGDLAEVLEKISGVIRQRIELFGLVRGLTAEGRLSGWVLFALPFIVFIAVMYMNPDYGNTLLNEPRGKIMLTVAAGMQLMGLAMIRWIVNIKV